MLEPLRPSSRKCVLVSRGFTMLDSHGDTVLEWLTQLVVLFWGACVREAIE